jgi:hypothetical protein
VISFQFSVEANMRDALYCALGTNHTDPLSKSRSRFLNLFDQAKQHPFDLGDPGIQNCELLVGKQVQVSSKKNVVLQFAGRLKKDEEKLLKFRIGRPVRLPASQSVTFPPGEQLGEILYERPSCEEVCCIYLELNTDNC